MTTVGSATRFGSELRAICGAEHVIEDATALHDRLILGAAPGVEVAPAFGRRSRGCAAFRQ